jgi:dihydrofolate reductase
MRIEAIAALDSCQGIGKEGTIPWTLPKDLQHFREVTQQHIVVMGLKTWVSLPCKPLFRRRNWVLSTTKSKKDLEVDLPEDAKKLPNMNLMCFSDVWDLLNFAGRLPLVTLFVIGGATVYEKFFKLPYVYRPEVLHLTRVDGDFGADTFFPAFENDYALVSQQDPLQENGIPFHFETWAKRALR